MTLNEKQVTLRRLTPTEGMWLTQMSKTDARIFSQEIYLAVNDSPENWREATEQERLEWEEAEKARMEAELAEHEREMSNE